MKELSLLWLALVASWIPWERDFETEISIQDFIRINTGGREKKAGLGKRIKSQQIPTQSHGEFPSELS